MGKTGASDCLKKCQRENMEPFTCRKTAMFTIESPEFREWKKHKARSDFSVCSADSVVKSIACLYHVPGDWRLENEPPRSLGTND